MILVVSVSYKMKSIRLQSYIPTQHPALRADSYIWIRNCHCNVGTGEDLNGFVSLLGNAYDVADHTERSAELCCGRASAR